MTKTELRNEMVKFVVECYPEYRGKLMFGIGELARMFTNNNPDKMRETIKKYGIPHYNLLSNSHKCYFLVEVFAAIYQSRTH